MNFRNDILRGVRLFLIAFSAILVVYGAYQMFHQPPGVEGAAAPEAAQPQPVEAAAEPHPLVVPAPPPAEGRRAVASGVPAPPPRGSRSRPVSTAVPDAPAPVVRSSRATVQPTGREFETPVVNSTPTPVSEASTEVTPAPARRGIGYKSLLEANQNRPVEVEPAPVAAVEQPTEKPKGSRFARAVGKWFKSGSGKKESTPLTLQQPKP